VAHRRISAPSCEPASIGPFGSIACFAAGCALAAGLYLWIGFWSLAVPVALSAISAILQARN
jgi:hypothetical protein